MAARTFVKARLRMSIGAHTWRTLPTRA